MSSKTRCLIFVGDGRSDGSHESNPFFSCNYQNFQGSHNLGNVYDGHKRRRQGNPIPQSLLEDCVENHERWSRAKDDYDVAKLHVSKKKQQCCTTWDIYCNVGENQAHLGIQHGKCARAPQFLISVQCRPIIKGWAGNPRAIQDEKHAKATQ